MGTILLIMYLLICLGYSISHFYSEGINIGTIIGLILSPMLVPIHIGRRIYDL